nr:pilus assembly protein PilP [Bacteriovorax sp. HI3]
MKFFIISLIMLFSVDLHAQESSNQYNLFKSKTYVKNPLDLRDPFKRRINKKKSNQVKARERLNGIYTNYTNSLEGRSIESLHVIGVVIGAERRAMIKVSDDNKGPGGEIIYVKEGMKVGENGAEVKAILPGGVVLVEKIRNVYDQDEYLETVIPVSND